MTILARDNQLSIAEVRQRLAEICEKAKYQGEDVVITKHGKPTGAIISMEDYEFLKEMVVRRSRKELAEK